MDVITAAIEWSNRACFQIVQLSIAIGLESFLSVVVMHGRVCVFCLGASWFFSHTCAKEEQQSFGLFFP